MPIDSSIYQNIQVQPTYNALDQYAKRQQLEHVVGQNDLAKLLMQEKQREIQDNAELRDLTRQTGGDTKKLMQALYGAGRYKEGMALGKDLRTQQKEAADLNKTNAELAHKNLEITGQVFGDVRANPTLDNAMAAIGHLESLNVIPKDRAAQMRQQVNADPSQIQTLADSAFRSALSAKDQLPKYDNQNTGGQTQTLQTDPITGKVKVVNTIENTQTKDSIATNASREKIAQLGRAQTERHFNANQNTPQYIETDAGLVALPKKLGAGQAPTATPVMGADGQPLGKPLKPIPASVNSAIIANRQSNNQIDRALTLLSGENIGNPKEGGMEGDKSATGFKGMLPQAILNRVDPKGVATRAEIADIGSLKIHDRSGAAVTISEAPRLMPFIPTATDDAATVEKKLRRLKLEIENESKAMGEFYGKDQGYRPAPPAPNPMSPTKANASAMDKQAAEWAKANPNDPRAAAINKRLGL